MMGWSPFADWCRDPARPWGDSEETAPSRARSLAPAPNFPFDCFDPFHSQQCTGFGASEFCHASSCLRSSGGLRGTPLSEVRGADLGAEASAHSRRCGGSGVVIFGG
jgi:hypothetical protein